MFEISIGRSTPIVRQGPSVRSTISAPTLARANMACGYYNGAIVVSGGFAQPANPYPNNANLVTLSADRLSVASTAAPAGYDGTSTHSCPNGDRLWIAMGHDGAYQAYIKSRVISTGAVTGSNSSACPGGGRLNASIYVENADSILYGLGHEATAGWRKDLWRYKPSNNSWTRTTDVPATYYPNWFSEAIKGADGQIYLATDNRELEIIRFNPTTNTWSRTASFVQFVGTGAYRPMQEAGTVALGNYILFFKAGMFLSQQSSLCCYRYDTVNDSWDCLNLPGQPALYSPRAVADVASNKIFIIGGALQHEGVQTYNLSTKNANILVYNRSDFL